MASATAFLQRIFSVIMSFLMTFLGNFGIVSNHFDTYAAVKYGDAAAQVMDIYVPSGADKNSTNSAVLFLHGGMFNDGSRNDMKTDCRNLTNKGYVTAAMDYSYLNQDGVSMFTLLDEITLAIQKLAELSAEKGLNIKHLALAGNGAGGYLAMMYAYTNTDYAAIDIDFVAAKASPTDFSPAVWKGTYSDEALAKLISKLSTVTVKTEDVTNNAKNVRDAVSLISPAAAVRSGKPVPTLFAHGGKDRQVPYGNQGALENALKEKNVPYKYVDFPNSDSGMKLDIMQIAEYDEAMLNFCTKYFA